jgi:hypothetical protein
MREAIDRKTVALTRSYLTRPQDRWPDPAHRQVRKLESKIQAATKAAERKEDLIEEVLALARLRTSYAPPPIYLTNIGSSGSHWLEAMLARATDAHNCGEVYLPEPLRAELAQLPLADAAYFLHALYALHSRSLGPKVVAGRFINSAHLSRVSKIADLTPGSLRVLLIRNPVDVVMSRTFRKDAYRAEVGANMDDAAYLERNCAVVDRFYLATSAEAFDARVRYEDLIAQPKATLSALIESLDLSTNDDAIVRAVTSTSSAAVRSAKARGQPVPTNLFMGERAAEDAALRARVRERLRACCELLGYGP